MLDEGIRLCLARLGRLEAVDKFTLPASGCLIYAGCVIYKR